MLHKSNKMKNLTGEDNINKSILNSFGVKDEVEDDDDMKKSHGEGSKGGKVIGHTRSGKPIYKDFHHEGHKDFTAEDHDDASQKLTTVTGKSRKVAPDKRANARLHFEASAKKRGIKTW